VAGTAKTAFLGNKGATLCFLGGAAIAGGGEGTGEGPSENDERLLKEEEE